MNYFSKLKNYKFLVCRHGQSLWNKENKFSGWSDISLTKKGIKDAFCVGNILNTNNLIPDKIFTSDTKRTIETSEIIQKILSLDVDCEENWRLNGRHYGGCEGIVKSYVEKRYGTKYFNNFRKNYLTRPPSLEDLNFGVDRLNKSLGKDSCNSKKFYYQKNNLVNFGESGIMLNNRLVYFFDDKIFNLGNDFNLPLIVCHRSTMKVMYKNFLNLSDDEYSKLNFDNQTILLFENNNNEKNITLIK